jgi:N-acetylneuraminic acid mutarotase
MNVSRWGHTATRLNDGRVLVAGGATCDRVLASAEIYDPGTGTWTGTGSMTTVRVDHVAVLLEDRRVLVAGGYNGGGTLASAEIYDPAAGTWTPIPSLSAPRAVASAAIMRDGRVLLAGGTSGHGTAPNTLETLASAEIYDPGTDTWSTTADMATPRIFGTMTLLGDRDILMAGGADYSSPSGAVLNSAELFDPVPGTWSTTSAMNSPRIAHVAVLLNDDTVLVAGGWDGTATLASAELYDPGARTWSGTAGMSTPRQGPSAALLNDGTVLTAGGSAGSGPLGTAEVYDPAPAAAWEPSTNTLGLRYSAALTVLLNGDALVIGGQIGNTDTTDALASAELFRRS